MGLYLSCELLLEKHEVLKDDFLLFFKTFWILELAIKLIKSFLNQDGQKTLKLWPEIGRKFPRSRNILGKLCLKLKYLHQLCPELFFPGFNLSLDRRKASSSFNHHDLILDELVVLCQNIPVLLVHNKSEKIDGKLIVCQKIFTDTKININKCYYHNFFAWPDL